jgi:hypothetical protein
MAVTEIILTNEIFISVLQFASLIGFAFLAVLTFISYRKLQAKMLVYIAWAFTVIAISLVFQVVLPLMESVLPISEITLDTIGEAIQFIAAFLFFTGLKLIKK